MGYAFCCGSKGFQKPLCLAMYDFRQIAIIRIFYATPPLSLFLDILPKKTN